jgi:hypothetical protein
MTSDPRLNLMDTESDHVFPLRARLQDPEDGGLDMAAAAARRTADGDEIGGGGGGGGRSKGRRKRSKRGGDERAILGSLNAISGFGLHGGRLEHEQGV